MHGLFAPFLPVGQTQPPGLPSGGSVLPCGSVAGLPSSKVAPITPANRVQSPRRPAGTKKSLAQHFLVSRRVLGRIVRAAELSPGDVVVEIGPGRGILTRELANRAARVVAVEIDEGLAAGLSEEFRGHRNVEIVRADAREIAIESLVSPETPYKVVANLPYYAASPIVRRFLEAAHKPNVMIFMVQREVAKNMAAAPGDMTVLSVLIQLYGEPRIVSYVPPGAFRPAPKVTSAVVRIRVYPEPALALDSRERFLQLVKAGFSSRRKQVHNCLRQGLSLSAEATEAMLSRAGIDPKRRAQTLSLPEWGGLYDAFRQSTDLSS